jgi:hypothetical protein
MDVKVGDEVIVTKRQLRGVSESFTAVVTKVARKYFTAEYTVGGKWTYQTQFAIADGVERGSESYGWRAQTPESKAAEDYRKGLNERAKSHRLQFDWGSAWGSAWGYGGERLSNEALEAILVILDAERDRVTS